MPTPKNDGETQGTMLFPSVIALTSERDRGLPPREDSRRLSVTLECGWFLRAVPLIRPCVSARPVAGAPSDGSGEPSRRRHGRQLDQDLVCSGSSPRSGAAWPSGRMSAVSSRGGLNNWIAVQPALTEQPPPRPRARRGRSGR